MSRRDDVVRSVSNNHDHHHHNFYYFASGCYDYYQPFHNVDDSFGRVYGSA
jgi:hypothetical protein